MSKVKEAEVHVHIEKMTVVNVIRNVVHQRGKATVAVGELTASNVGGDVVSAGSKRRKKRGGKKRLARTAVKAITGGFALIGSFGVTLAASAIANAAGWT